MYEIGESPRKMTDIRPHKRTVTDDASRVALSRILASERFLRSVRLSEFLAYVMEETLAGRGDLIRGKTIAMDVYRRDPTDSGQSENVVRVDARRLRRSLEEYYATVGKDDAVRIWVDSGGYVPRMEIRNDVSLEKPTVWSGIILPRVVLGILGILAIGIAATVYLKGAPSRTMPMPDQQIVLERQALREKSAVTLQAANLAEQARGFLFPVTEPERQKIAADMFRQVIRLDPDYFGGYAGLAQTLTTFSKLTPPGPKRDETLAQARRMAKIATTKNPTHSWTQSASAWAAFGNGDFDHAFDLSSRSILINPEDGYVLDFYAMISVLSGRFEEARKASDPARPRGSTKRRFANRNLFGVANLHLERYQEAIVAFQRAADLGDPISAPSLMYQAAAYQGLGNSDRAFELIQEMAATWPGFQPDVALPNFYQHQKHVDQILDHLRAAGWVPSN